MANKSSDSVSVPGKQSRNERIEEFLREHYAFRYNTVKSRAEFRSSDGEFLPVTKYRLNSFRRELDRTIGISTSAENLRSMLESDFSERVNPVQAYFRKLPLTAGTQAIDELAATVTVRNTRHWSEYLTKWLVGVVANAMNDDGCQNHVCLVLTGEQGKFKTTWLDNLCPNLRWRVPGASRTLSAAFHIRWSGHGMRRFPGAVLRFRLRRTSSGIRRSGVSGLRHIPDPY